MSAPLKKQVLGSRRGGGWWLAIVVLFAFGLAATIAGFMVSASEERKRKEPIAGPTWETETVASAGYRGNGVCSIATDSKNHVYLTFQDAVERSLRFAAREYGAWAISRVGDHRSVGTYSGIAIFDGRANLQPAVVYSSAIGSLRFAWGSSGAWRSDTVDRHSWGETGLMLDALGNPHVAYSSKRMNG